jgi:hypothetical protein
MTSAALPSPRHAAPLASIPFAICFPFSTPVTSKRFQDAENSHNGNLFFDDEKEFDQRSQRNFCRYYSRTLSTVTQKYLGIKLNKVQNQLLLSTMSNLKLTSDVHL